MPFGLKNVKATYKQMINKIFKEEIGHFVEVYVNDILDKSQNREDHADDLSQIFKVLRKYNIKLNSEKCTSRVTSGKFLGFMMTSQGIKINPKKIKALLEMK